MLKQYLQINYRRIIAVLVLTSLCLLGPAFSISRVKAEGDPGDCYGSDGEIGACEVSYFDSPVCYTDYNDYHTLGDCSTIINESNTVCFDYVWDTTNPCSSYLDQSAGDGSGNITEPSTDPSTDPYTDPNTGNSPGDITDPAMNPSSDPSTDPVTTEPEIVQLTVPFNVNFEVTLSTEDQNSLITAINNSFNSFKVFLGNRSLSESDIYLEDLNIVGQAESSDVCQGDVNGGCYHFDYKQGYYVYDPSSSIDQFSLYSIYSLSLIQGGEVYAKGATDLHAFQQYLKVYAGMIYNYSTEYTQDYDDLIRGIIKDCGIVANIDVDNLIFNSIYFRGLVDIDSVIDPVLLESGIYKLTDHSLNFSTNWTSIDGQDAQLAYLRKIKAQLDDYPNVSQINVSRAGTGTTISWKTKIPKDKGIILINTQKVNSAGVDDLWTGGTQVPVTTAASVDHSVTINNTTLNPAKAYYFKILYCKRYEGETADQCFPQREASYIPVGNIVGSVGGVPNNFVIEFPHILSTQIIGQKFYTEDQIKTEIYSVYNNYSSYLLNLYKAYLGESNSGRADTLFRFRANKVIVDNDTEVQMACKGEASTKLVVFCQKDDVIYLPGSAFTNSEVKGGMDDNLIGQALLHAFSTNSYSNETTINHLGLAEAYESIISNYLALVSFGAPKNISGYANDQKFMETLVKILNKTSPNKTVNANPDYHSWSILIAAVVGEGYGILDNELASTVTDATAKPKTIKDIDLSDQKSFSGRLIKLSDSINKYGDKYIKDDVLKYLNLVNDNTVEITGDAALITNINAHTNWGDPIINPTTHVPDPASPTMVITWSIPPPGGTDKDGSLINWQGGTSILRYMEGTSVQDFVKEDANPSSPAQIKTTTAYQTKTNGNEWSAEFEGSASTNYAYQIVMTNPDGTQKKSTIKLASVGTQSDGSGSLKAGGGVKTNTQNPTKPATGQVKANGSSTSDVLGGTGTPGSTGGVVNVAPCANGVGTYNGVLVSNFNYDSGFFCYVSVFMNQKFGFILFLALIMIVFSGVQYMSSGFSPGGEKVAKERLMGIITGLVFFLITRMIVAAISNNLGKTGVSAQTPTSYYSQPDDRQSSITNIKKG